MICLAILFLVFLVIGFVLGVMVCYIEEKLIKRCPRYRPCYFDVGFIIIVAIAIILISVFGG